MNLQTRTFLGIAIAAVLAGCSLQNSNNSVAAVSSSQGKAASFEIAATSPTSIRVATWNVEHLAYPISMGCKPRTQEELRALKEYATSLDADVVALQEVASSAAVHLLFPENEWQVVMSDRPDSEPYVCRGNRFTSSQQKVAFAVRKSLVVSSSEQVASFGLSSPGLRYGLAISVKKDNELIEILNLHLKSGCFVDDYQRSDSPACQTFAQQVPILDNWIEQREKSKSPYMILGDFNHRLSAPYNRVTQTIKSNQDGTPSSLHITTQNIIGCNERYPAPIDHIIVGALPLSLRSQNVTVHAFNDMKENAMLSDHCAISLELQRHTQL